MLRFAHIEYLWALVIIPVFIIAFLAVSVWKRKAISSLGDKKVVMMMMPQVSLSRPWIKFIFFILAFAMLVIGIADPQIGSKTEEVKRKGADLMILLDVLGPAEGFAAETVASSVLYYNALVLGAPISTTHTITSAIMGVGATKKLSAVRWGVAGNIVTAWVLTFPGAAAIAVVSYLIVRPIF